MREQTTEYRGLVISILTKEGSQTFRNIIEQKGADKFYHVQTVKETVITNHDAIISVTNWWEHGDLTQSEPFSEEQWAKWDVENE